MTVWPVVRQFRQFDGNSPSPVAERLIAWVAPAAAPHRVSPDVTGRAAGSVAAQRTDQQGLAVSGPDSVLVRKLPAVAARRAVVQVPRPGGGILGNRRVSP